MNNSIRVPIEYPVEITDSILSYKNYYPETATTAFIIMKFGNTPTHKKIVEAIKETLNDFGIVGIRADDKEYHDDLYYNVMTHIYGCKIGIAVFERIERDEFNPNVALEIGYLLALKKPVCILKDRTLSTLQTDLMGKLYKTFDSQEPSESISAALQQWLTDKGFLHEGKREDCTKEHENQPIKEVYNPSRSKRMNQETSFERPVIAFGHPFETTYESEILMTQIMQFPGSTLSLVFTDGNAMRILIKGEEYFAFFEHRDIVRWNNALGNLERKGVLVFLSEAEDSKEYRIAPVYFT